MATAVPCGAADVIAALVSTPARIAAALASIIGVRIIGVSVVVAMPSVATGRGRRVPATTRAALAGQSLVKVGRGGSVLHTLREGHSLRIFHILVLLVRRHQCIQLLAHLSRGCGILRDQLLRVDAIEQLFLDVCAQGSLILCAALISELIEHVFVGGF
jgi:hypothetical protein